ncbi:MAG: hypothetical protein A3E93_00785 [Candidatus Zambryskibacteria bacterium RIFCSPHIGHO2_12_FULL_43_12b]|nr:MAG: hypothetical protein A3E93_00785 [Candidatus Zambryskibacteria bacterium RIFCSPHIGHO2_12_FULL_43_12b]
MSKNKIVFFIGVVLLIMPFLGFPPGWKSFIAIVFGITLIFLSFSAAAKRRASARRTRRIKQQEVHNEHINVAPNVTILQDVFEETKPSETIDKDIPPTV